MQHMDKDLGRICEEKNRLLCSLVVSLGGDSSMIQLPKYEELLNEATLSPQAAKELQIESIQVRP